MVKRLHDAGIEIILDVVYNHTAEGNHMGPMLSFRGIDNASYYRLADDKRFYWDSTGTGNTLNLEHPRVLQMVMDSLRYWATEMHVDGFRFDLCTALCREGNKFDNGSAFLDAVRQDPELNLVKLIAEPWDIGADGYQLGSFPPGWAEWNASFRDTIRRFWKGDTGLIAELGSRLTGSSDIFGHQGRRPWSSINFITAHDGFTLHDLVSYNDKNNEANGEGSRDGHDANFSWNCGIEGETEDPEIRALRNRQKRNLLASLLLSLGVPMLLGATKAATLNVATTTPIARTMKPPGSRGLISSRRMRNSAISSWRSFASAASTACSPAPASSEARSWQKTGSRTSPGWPPTGANRRQPIGTMPMRYV